jgi:hypothetical protein
MPDDRLRNPCIVQRVHYFKDHISNELVRLARTCRRSYAEPARCPQALPVAGPQSRSTTSCWNRSTANGGEKVQPVRRHVEFARAQRKRLQEGRRLSQLLHAVSKKARRRPARPPPRSYLAYVPYGTVLFDRLIASTRAVGTLEPPPPRPRAARRDPFGVALSPDRAAIRSSERPSLSHSCSRDYIAAPLYQRHGEYDATVEIHAIGGDPPSPARPPGRQFGHDVCSLAAGSLQ